MWNFKSVKIFYTFLLLVSCNGEKHSDSDTLISNAKSDSLKQIISILEQENKSKIIENNNLKSELSIYSAQNDYIKKITVEYNSIHNTLSDVLHKQISIINNTNNIESNRIKYSMSTAAKLKQYINMMEKSYQTSN